MATFDEFYSSLDSDPGIRGKQFEKFVKWFLKNDPVWASQVKDIWLWDEHPKRSEWGPDCGIDLVFDDYQNKTWAVQAKCFAPKSSIKKEDMDSFISEASDSRFQGRLLVASTDRIGSNADRLLNRHEVVRYLLNDLRHSDLIFPQSPNDLSKGKRKDLRKPRPHQLDAIDAVVRGLKTNDRGQVLMACGTGKTLTSLWIKEKLLARQVLVLLPSLSLLSQTLKEWNAAASNPFKWICVCSDKSVAKEDKTEDDWITNTSEIGVPVTSDLEEIKKFLNETDSKIVFSTYQSSPLIAKAQEEKDINAFDVVFADEAHRCVGIVSTAFGCVLDEKKIRANKRLFFTATPKVVSNRIKGQVKKGDIKIASMDDKSKFGNVLYQLKFSDAIKKDLLSDYQVVIVGVDDQMVKEKIINRDLMTIDDEDIFDAEKLASKIALTKAIKDYKLKRVITFHGRVKGAERFAQDLKKVRKLIPEEDLPKGNIHSEHVCGSMKSSERNEKIQRLKNLNKEDIRILTNARCLSEGVDVPSLDGIGFIDPKNSQVDIIQAIGRAIRKSEDKSCGTILIPIYLGNLKNAEDEILTSRFKKVWQIILGLKSQDDSLMTCIDNFRINIGAKKISNFNDKELEKIIFDLPIRIPENFSSSIKTLLVKNTTDNWLEKYGELKRFKLIEKHVSPPQSHTSLGPWVSQQRSFYRKKNTALTQERINLLNAIGFIWEKREGIWETYFLEISKYISINGNSRISIHESSLGTWVDKQRQRYKNNLLSDEKIKRLEQIGFEWDVNVSIWEENYKELEKYFLKNGHSNIDIRQTGVGVWVDTQRQKFRKGKLTKEEISKLRKLKFIFNFDDERWDKNFKELKKLITLKEKLPTQKESSLGKWISRQRTYFATGKLSKEKIERLEDIGFVWNPLEKQWDETFKKLQEFVLENNSYPTKKENYSLKTFITNTKKRKEGLTKERISKLETLPNWTW